MTPGSTIAEIQRDLQTGKKDAVTVLAECEARADSWEPELGIYLHRAREAAVEAAHASDTRRAAGKPLGPLDGVPVGVKDIVRTHDAPTTGQSLVSPWTAPGTWGPDAPVVARLRRAGAVITGKTTTLEHAMGFSDPEKGFPMTRNPWDGTRWSGGSSSGSASGIAVGAFAGAVGTDTAGSIRMPAGWCGLTGLKPTYGLVPAQGVLPLSWSLDHVGPMAATADDCALLLSVLVDQAPETWTRSNLDPAQLRVGVLTDALERSEPAVRAVLEAAFATLAAAGVDVVEVRAPHYDAGVSATMATLAAEAYALHRTALSSRWHDFSAATRNATLRGVMLTAADLVQAGRLRAHLADQVDRLFDDVDLLIGPTASTTAPALEGLDFGKAVAAMQTIYWDGTGHPALSVPAGRADDGLPVGLQVIGPWGADATVLDFGRRWQELTTHHLAEPAPWDSSLVPVLDRPSAAPDANPSDLERLRQLLDADGVHPDDVELRAAAADWPTLRSELAAIHDISVPRPTAPIVRSAG